MFDDIMGWHVPRPVVSDTVISEPSYGVEPLSPSALPVHAALALAPGPANWPYSTRLPSLGRRGSPAPAPSPGAPSPAAPSPAAPVPNPLLLPLTC
eukprot:746550-Hanusia_phi.AAC.2